MQEQKVTETEWLLVQSLRNYRRGYPNTKFLRETIEELVITLLDPSYREELN